MRKFAIATAVLLAMSIAVVPQPALADDRWSANCNETRDITTSNYSGTLSPADQDALRVNIPEGDSVSVSLTWDSGMEIRIFDDVAWSYEEEQDIQEVESEEPFSTLSIDPQHTEMNNADYFRLEGGQQPFNAKIFSEGQGPICIGLSAAENSGDWQMNVAVVDEEPPTESREQLKQELAEKNETIDQLQTEVQRLNSTVEQLEQRVTALEQRVTSLEGNSSSGLENSSAKKMPFVASHQFSF